MINIPITKLKPHPQNPRKDLGDLTELKDSIKSKGVLQNLTVVPNDDDTYTIIIGHRRHAASILAGLEELPCQAVEMTEQEQLETMLLENMQRSDLTIYEQAQGFQLLIDLGASVADVSKSTGFSESTIRRRTKLLELDKKLFEESQKRQPTLEQYAELDRLENVEHKNLALKSLGTNNFAYTLERLVEEEKVAKAKTIIEEHLLSFAEEISFDDVDRNKLCDVYSAWFWSYNNQDKELFEPEQNTKYFVAFDKNKIVLYRELTAEEIMQRKNESETDDEIENKKKLFKEMSAPIFERVLGLIDDFVKKYSGNKAHFDFLFEEFIKFNLVDIQDDDTYKIWGNYASNSITWKIKDYFDIQVTGEASWNAEVKLDDFIEKCLSTSGTKSKFLLVAILLTIDIPNHPYCEYYSGKHIPNPLMDKLYEILEFCGYQMSDEEIALQNGTHEIFSIVPSDEDE